MLGSCWLRSFNLPSFRTIPPWWWRASAAILIRSSAIGLAVPSVFRLSRWRRNWSTQMGFSAIQMFDPMSHQNAPIIANFQLTLGSLVFLSLNAHLMVVHAIGMSYEFVPPFGVKLSDSIATDIIHLAQNMLGVALKMAAPVL